MKFIVKPHPEIFVKSESVRKRFTKILESNIRIIVKARTQGVAVFNRRDHIEVTSNSDTYYAEVLEILTTTPGIQQVLEVQQSSFTDLHNIYEQVLELNRANLENKPLSCARNAVVSMILPLLNSNVMLGVASIKPSPVPR